MTDLFHKSEPQEGDTIVVWFSNGAASAVAWQETIQKYGNLCQVVAVNNPIKEEDEDNLRFARDVSAWLGQDLVYALNPRFPGASTVEVWEKERAMCFPHGAPCTKHLKRFAREHYERTHRVDWHVFGFTVEEKDRHERFVLGERSNVLAILIEAKLTKQQCYDRLISEGVIPPRMYEMGYPNANCPGCVKSQSATYWNHTRRQHPAVFEQRAEMSRRLGVKLVRYKGQRIYLDDLPADAIGRPLKTMKMPECGIFCEERPSKRKPRALEAAE